MDKETLQIFDFITTELVLWVVTHGLSVLLGVVLMWGPRRYRRWKLKPLVETGYGKLRMVCEPQTLNPAKPGNPGYMKSDARDFINPLGPKLQKAGFYPPDKCTADDNSLNEWFNFFEKVRMEI